MSFDLPQFPVSKRERQFHERRVRDVAPAEEPEHDGARRPTPISRRRRYVKVGRVLFVLALAYVAVASFLGWLALHRLGFGDASARGSTTAQAWPDDSAKAFAARFAQTTLTYSPSLDDQEARSAAMRAMMSPKLDPERVLAPPADGRQRVLGTWPAGHRRSGAQSADIVVAATVQTSRSSAADATPTAASTSYLSVPVTRGAAGGLIVDAYPAPVSPPRAAPAPRGSEVAIDEINAAPIDALLSRFLEAYLRGGATAPEFLAPGVTVVPLGRRYTNVDIVSTALDGPSTGRRRRVLVVVQAVDANTRAPITARYRITVVYNDRWLVETVQ